VAVLPLVTRFRCPSPRGGTIRVAQDVASNAFLPVLSERLGYAQRFHVRIDASADGQH